MVMLALSQKWPVLLYGPPGAGKSALINKIASDSHNQGSNRCSRHDFLVCFCVSGYIFVSHSGPFSSVGNKTID